MLTRFHAFVMLTILAVITGVTVMSPTTYAQEPFITTWKTDNPGTSEDNQITIPTFPKFIYDYDVDWGDGNSDTGVTGDITHTYDTPGTYTVEITGDFPQVWFANVGDKGKILSIEQWGDIAWSSMDDAFWGASNLEVNATDIPNLSGVTRMASMFRGASAFNQDVGGWDVSNVTIMAGMFNGASTFNQDLSEWDVSNATNMGGMFNGASAFNQDLGSWDISSVLFMNGMFDGSNLSTENYDDTLVGWTTQDVQENVPLGAEGLTYCAGAAARQSLIDDNGWTILGDQIEDPACTGGGSGPEFITTWKTDNPGTSENNQITIPTFPKWPYDYDVDWGDGNSDTGATGSITHTYDSPGIYTVEITGDFPHIWFNNGGDREKILSVEQWGDIEWISMDSAFQGASNLQINATDIPDLSGVTSMARMFMGASALDQDLSDWDVSGVTNMFFMLADANSFNQDLGGLDISNVTNMSGMLDNSGLSIANYDATLIGWAAQDVQSSVELDANGLTYCDGADARQSLIDDHGWTIAGDLLCGGAPENDTIADAIVLTESGTYEGTNVDATLEDGEPEPSCTFQDWTTNFSVWWSFTATGDGFVSIDTFDSTFDTILSLHDASDFSEVACNDDSGGVLQSQIEEASVVEGETYLIRVAGYNEQSPGQQQGDIVLTTDFQFGIADDASPEEIAEGLSLPSPNPVNGTATLTLTVENGQHVAVEVFDATGRRVQTIYDGTLATGTSETLTLDAFALPAGVYMIRATGEDFTRTRRVTILR